MHTEQLVWSSNGGWGSPPPRPASPPTFVLVLGGRRALSETNALSTLAEVYPREVFFGCSTAGEIADIEVHDDHVVATAVWLERSHIAWASLSLDAVPDSAKAGAQLGSALSHDGLVHVLVLSDGTKVNGSALVEGLMSTLPKTVHVSGGLSGDGTAFQQTVLCFRGEVSAGLICVIGFYGDIKVGIGSLGGWDPFGAERVVTSSNANVLRTLDGEPALELYKRYLGLHASSLPASALRFPLLVRLRADADPVVRTVLSVNEADGTMTFAGDVPQGATAQLMRANFDRLIGGASGAATASLTSAPVQLAVLISCVGRRLVLTQRIEEEAEAVKEVLGPSARLAGFYSYGELAPFGMGDRCQLHNQTMTVTTFTEA